MKRIHYIILTAVLMVLAYCGGQIDTPAPQAQQQPVSAKGPWELHTTDSYGVAWRINTDTGKTELLNLEWGKVNTRGNATPIMSNHPVPGP
jgi:hypothetical protein